MNKVFMNMLDEFSEKTKQIILSQLFMGAACRIHLHRECCRELGFSIVPLFNCNGQRIRICKDIPDLKFDKPFKDLLKTKMIEKVVDIGGFAFYKLTQKGKQELNQ